MQRIGGWLFCFGAGSAVLRSFDYELKLLMWVDNWGTGIGWGIRAALIVVGAGLWFAGRNRAGTAA